MHPGAGWPSARDEPKVRILDVTGAGPAAHSRRKREKGQVMKVAGIIMECNPFHEGHAYLLREARRRTEADYIVVAMSGDFVQRGEPAVFDKYIRAEWILRAGADLVLELPLYAACSSAEYFARGGVALLDSLGVVTDLCFGSESGSTDSLVRAGAFLAAAEEELPLSAPSPLVPAQTLPDAGAPDLSRRYREDLRAGLKKGLSFPAAREAALPGGFPSSPNDLLAAEYCRALLVRESGIRPHAISRIRVPSATDRRRDLLRARTMSPDAPPAFALPQTSVSDAPLFPLGPDDFSAALCYALRTQAGDLERFADVSGDLADRIRRLLPRYDTFSGFCDLLKTRNMTRSRISRCLIHILLRMDQAGLDEYRACGPARWARPLALRRAASPLLSAIRRNASIPFLSRLSAAPSLVSDRELALLEEEFMAEDLYTMTLRQTAAACRRSGTTAEAPAFRGPDLPPCPPALQRKTIIDKSI